MDALLQAIRDMETLSDVDGDKLKIDTGKYRVWVTSSGLFIEELIDGAWVHAGSV